MSDNLKQFCAEIEIQISDSYTSGISMVEAESLAAKMLYAQLAVSDELKKLDLDARMKRAGLKSIKAAVYSNACSVEGKRPTEAALENIVVSNPAVLKAQQALDEAEVERDSFERYLGIFKECHVFYRLVSKGGN